MVTYLKTFNKVIQPMGSLQSGIAWRFLLPKEWSIIAIDLKLFLHYTFPKKGQRKIYFTMPTYNVNLLRAINGMFSEGDGKYPHTVPVVWKAAFGNI